MSVKSVREFQDTIETTRLDNWKTKVAEVETAKSMLAEKIRDAEAHLEACPIGKTCHCKSGRLEQIVGLGELVRLVRPPRLITAQQ